MIFKILTDGSLLYLKDPPKSLSGFTVDPTDPNRFFPDFCECRHRHLQQYVKPCKKIGTRYWCALFKREVNVPFCEDCEESDNGK